MQVSKRIYVICCIVKTPKLTEYVKKYKGVESVAQKMKTTLS